MTSSIEERVSRMITAAMPTESTKAGGRKVSMFLTGSLRRPAVWPVAKFGGDQPNQVAPNAMIRIAMEKNGTDNQKTLTSRTSRSTIVPGRTAENMPGGMPSTIDKKSAKT